LDMRMPLPEDREQGWKKMLAGDRTGGDQQFTGDWRFVAGDLPPSLPIEVKYPLGVGIELLPRFGQQHPTGPAIEQALVECFFEGLNTLTDRCLRQAESFRRPGEATQLSGFRERSQMWKLNVL
jgi:hypothetical protein